MNTRVRNKLLELTRVPKYEFMRDIRDAVEEITSEVSEATKTSP